MAEKNSLHNEAKPKKPKYETFLACLWNLER